MIDVSVVIATYNEEKYVSKCLSTILDQTYPSYEVIVVDDGSSDNTVSIVKSFIPKGIKFYEKIRGGPASARNYGASKAKGNILVFLDHDMRFSRSFIEDLVRPIKKDGVVGTYHVGGGAANYTHRWVNPIVRLAKLNEAKHDSLEPGKIFRAIRKNKFDEIGGYDSIGYNDDETIFRKLGIHSIPVKASAYHYYPENLLEIYKTSNWWARCDRCKKSFRNLLHYSLPNSIRWGLIISCKIRNINYLIIRVIQDFGVFMGLLKKIIFTKQDIYK